MGCAVGTQIIFLPVSEQYIASTSMKGGFYVKFEGKHYGPFGDVPIRPGEMCSRIGYLDTNFSWMARMPKVYQLGVREGKLCASRWETIPPDTLWNARGKMEIFFTHAQFDNLDFRNTPFEHRANLIADRSGKPPELVILSQKELKLWGENMIAFIPFRNPHPQGYRGISGNFDIVTDLVISSDDDNICKDLFVCDEFRSGHHLLEMT